MFRTNLVVHHQKQGIIYCITQFGTIGTIVQASLDWSARLYRLYCVIQYIMPCSWWWKTRFVRNMLSRHKTIEWKIDYKNCASRWSLQYDARYTQRHISIIFHSLLCLSCGRLIKCSATHNPPLFLDPIIPTTFITPHEVFTLTILRYQAELYKLRLYPLRTVLYLPQTASPCNPNSFLTVSVQIPAT